MYTYVTYDLNYCSPITSHHLYGKLKFLHQPLPAMHARWQNGDPIVQGFQ